MKHLVLLSCLLIGSVPTFAAPSEDWMSGFQMPVVTEPTIPARTMRVTDFGAVPDGRTLCTESIAKGIATLAEQGGGHLVFPAGVWLTGPIELKSNIDLHTEEGALIQFSRDLSLFKNPGLLYGENLENISISGPGIIDGSGGAWRHVKKGKTTENQWKALIASGGRLAENGTVWYPRTSSDTWRPKLMVLLRCKKVLLEATTFQDSPDWNLHPRLCEDLTIRNVIIRNPWYSQNGDGLDIDACRDVIVRGVRLDVGDDALCLKSGKETDSLKPSQACENVLIEDCVVYHGHGGFTIGSEMSGGIRNVRVNNCVFIGTDIGLRFKSRRGRGNVVENIYISNIRMTDIPTDAISFSMYYAGAGPMEQKNSVGDVKAVSVDAGTPQFRDIFIQDVLCRGARRALQIQGLPEMPIRGIHLRNISITATRGIVCQDAQDITLQGIDISNTQGSVLEVIRSQDVRVDRLTYTSGTKSLLSLSGKNTAGVIIRNTHIEAGEQAITLAPGVSKDALKQE